MSKRQQSSRFVAVLLITALLGFNAWTGWTCSALRGDLADAQGRLVESERIAVQIEALRLRPVQVGTEVRSSDSLANLVESAAQRANINLERIVHIDPEEPRKVGDSPYVDQATGIELRHVTLRQLIQFTLAVDDSGAEIQVPRLTMRLPHVDASTGGDDETWNVQLGLTARIYAP